ncbi:glycan biosynthesis hexose transferase WsfD [Paenibacillus sedimenti]|uniref:Transmembrane protein n=1 Tax=Paenibacillus sedimenti TaxID=2770274 RepID=A0A926QIT2_9BACL|nr:hypothetical protein [Paenibacillus sedimenti]MBD0379824.1 hypothetical protein [Paenibacillus sedimenti]
MSKLIKWDTLALLAGAGVLGFLLLVGPILGMADNGDFLRIMGSVGLSYLDPTEPFQEKYFAFTHKQFAMSAPGIGGYISSEVIVVFLATLLGRLYNWQLFDIRFLGAMYSILLLVAFACLLQLKILTSSRAVKYSFSMIFLVIFFDVGYTAYFNSFFGEPMAFIFLLLTLAAALRLTEIKQPRTAWFVFFMVSAIFMAASKIQNAPAGIILALLSLRFLPLSNRKSWKRTGAALIALLVLVSTAIYVTAPRELRMINQYQSVFYGILKNSPSPEKDLLALGLDQKLAILAGTNYFMPDTPIPQQSAELKQSFYPHISHGKIARFYLSHPSRYWDKLQVTAQHAMTIHIAYLGNREKAAGFEPGAIYNSFNLWSELKRNLLPHSIWFLIGFWVLYYTVVLALYSAEPARHRRASYEVFISVGAIGAIAFLVPLIGDGEADMEKHLFLFNVCFDLMFTASLVWAIHQVVKFVRDRAS